VYLQKYPLAHKLKPTELVMRSGDILVFPRNTCHQTRVLSVSTARRPRAYLCHHERYTQPVLRLACQIAVAFMQSDARVPLPLQEENVSLSFRWGLHDNGDATAPVVSDRCCQICIHVECDACFPMQVQDTSSVVTAAPERCVGIAILAGSRT
jgi:hypothetical protein